MGSNCYSKRLTRYGKDNLKAFENKVQVNKCLKILVEDKLKDEKHQREGEKEREREKMT